MGISSRPRAGEPVKFVSKGGDTKSGLSTVKNTVEKSCSLLRVRNVLGTIIERKMKFSMCSLVQ